MRKPLQLIVALSSIFAASVAEAVPTAFYDRPTGNIYLQNDFSSSVPVVVFRSMSGRFTGTPNAIPGSTHEFSDLPFTMAFFSVQPNGSDFPPNPAKLYNLGPVVAEKGPLGDLSLSYFLSFVPGEPFHPGVFIEIPEPSALGMGKVGLFFLAISTGYRGYRTPRRA